MTFSVIDKSLLGILALFGLLTAHAQIEQEYLPYTHTLREMTLRLDVLEDNLRQIDLDVGIQEVRSIREQCEFLQSSLRASQQYEAHQLILRTLLFETVLNYYGERKTEAETIANELLRLDPSRTLSGKLATPELAGWFEDIRERHTGFITVISDPSGASVVLNDVEIGTTPLEHAFAPVGTHSIKIIREGYTPFEQTIIVEHNENQVINAHLIRNTGRLLVWISPPGTSISLDSSTDTLLTKPASPLLYPLIQVLGYHPADFSQPLVIQSIPTGERFISIEKDCRQPIDYRIRFDAADYYLPLLILPRTETRLSITTDQADNRVYVDNAYIGSTPLQNAVVCPGERLIRVEFNNQLVWSQTVILPPDTKTHLQAYPRPGTLFLGTVSSDPETAVAGDRTILQWLNQSGAFNVMNSATARQYRLRPSVASILEPVKQQSFDPADPDWNAKLADMVTSLRDSGASLFAFARLTPESSHEKAYLFFIHRDSARPDILPLPAGIPPADINRIVGRDLLQLPEMTRLQSGLHVTEINKMLHVSQIVPRGPSELSPLQPGDMIVELNGIPVATRKDFEAILRDPGSPESMPVTAIQNGKRIRMDIGMRRQPLIEALNSRHIPYNVILALLEVQAFSHAPVPEWLKINAGVCYLAMERPDKARIYFEDCSLTDAEGIGSGTLSYLKYLTETSLRNHTAAEKHYRSALESAGATIIHGDGPWLRNLLQ
jgi:hypothetical protein